MSESSGGSFNSRVGSDEPELNIRANADTDDQQDEDLQDKANESFEQGVFALLYHISKGGPLSSWEFAGIRIFLEWLQLFLLVVNPAYGWTIDASDNWWRTFSFISLRDTVSVRGYTFFLACLYIWCIALVACLGLCVWAVASLRHNEFHAQRLLVLVQWFRAVFLQVLDVAGFTLLLLPLDCGYFSRDVQNLGHMTTLPHIACWAMPHMIHVAVAVISALAFLVLAGGFTLGDVQPNPLGTEALGKAHSRVELCGFGLKMIMTALPIFVNDIRWMSVLMLISAVVLAYLYARWVPHQYALANCIRTAAFFSVAWAALVYVCLAFIPGDGSEGEDQRITLTAILWGGFGVMGGLGAAVAWWRLKQCIDTVVAKFWYVVPGTKPHRIHPFSDPREVEIASRCCRVWQDEDTLDPEAVAVAQAIIKAGLAMMPRTCELALLMSAFVMDVMDKYQEGYAQLKAARRLPSMSVLGRYLIYIREQENIQRATVRSEEMDADQGDLATYVEYQRDRKITIRLHLAALEARRAFWTVLMHRNVSFYKLTSAVQRIDITTRAAEAMYKKVLNRHSTSIELITLYIRFLQGVKNDAWAAARWTSEAEKLQRVEEEASHRAVLSNETDASQGEKGVVVIGANCLIRMVNEKAAMMLGYANRSDMVGRNVSIIVPPPFNKNHNKYVRRVIESGVSTAMNMEHELIVQHRDGYVLAVKMMITKIGGIGEDTIFMAVLEPLQTSLDAACVWVQADGGMLSCESRFTDWFGYGYEDICTCDLASILTTSDELKRQLSQLRHAFLVASGAVAPGTRASLECSSSGNSVTASIPLQRMLTARSLRQEAELLVTTACISTEVKHLYLPVIIPVDMHISAGGMGATVCFKIKFVRRLEAPPVPHLLVVDGKGAVCHATTSLLERLGYHMTRGSPEYKRIMKSVDWMIPAPFSKTHHQLCKEKLGGEVPAWSCMNGLTVCMMSSASAGHAAVPFSINVTVKESLGKSPVTVVSCEERTMDQALNERRLSLVVDQQGIVLSTSSSPMELFGIDVAGMVGTHVAYVIDVLRPDLAHTSSPDPGRLMRAEERAAATIAKMVELSFATPGMSWRVGVSPTTDPLALMALGPVGQSMMSKRMVPAVMTCTPHLPEPVIEGATATLPAAVQYKVELWRADLMSGVVELDAAGHIEALGMKGQPLHEPHLLLGVAPDMLLGAHVSSILPCGQPHFDALFSDSCCQAAGKTKKGHAAAGPRSAMRAGTTARKRVVGPKHVVLIRHGCDGEEVELSVHAVAKQGLAGSSGIYLLMRCTLPRCGRQGFADWLAAHPVPSLTRGCPARLRSDSGTLAATRRMSAGSTNRRASVHITPSTPSGHMAEGVARRSRHVSYPPVNQVPGAEAQTQGVGTLVSSALHSLEATHAVQLSFSPVPPADRPAPYVKPSGISWDTGLEEQPNLPIPSLKLSPHSSAPDADAMYDVNFDDSSSARGDSSVDMAGGGGWSGSDEGGGAGGRRVEVISRRPAPTSAAQPEGTDEEEDDADEGRYHHLDDDTNSPADAVLELKRGKRLKRLGKMLMGPVHQAVYLRLRHISWLVTASLVVVATAMFATFWTLTHVQVNQVMDLRTTSRAINRVMQVAIETSALTSVLSGRDGSQVLHLGEEGQEATINHLLQQLETQVQQLETYHRSVFRGSTQLRQLPNEYDLRQIWETPSNPIRFFYEGPTHTAFTDVNISLWDAGNLYVMFARDLLQNWRRQYPPGTNRSELILNNTAALFLVYNGPRSMIPFYTTTLDGLMQKASDDSDRLNEIQLVILAIEGLLLGLVVAIIMWMAYSKVMASRYALFNLFMLVPHGVLRTLATQPANLNLGRDTEAQVGQRDEDDGEGWEGGTRGQGNTGGDLAIPAANSLATRSTQPGAPTHDVAPHAGLRSLLTWFWPAAAVSRPGAKRQLQPSQWMLLTYNWPFLTWMCLVILLNGIGFLDLRDMRHPIAISNIVQFVSIRLNMVILLTQRYMSWQYFLPDFSAIAPLPQGSAPHERNPHSQYLYDKLLVAYPALRLEYDAMLYGARLPQLAGTTDPHFLLAPDGIMFSEGADLVFNSKVCHALQPEDCPAPDHKYYQYTHNGVDQAMQHLFECVESILNAHPSEINLHNPSFEYIYETGTGHLTGGLVHLTDVFSNYIKDMYMASMQVHVVLLVMCFVLAATFVFFVERRHHRRMQAEAKRVAQLLAALPTDMDVEGMVRAVLMANPDVP